LIAEILPKTKEAAIFRCFFFGKDARNREAGEKRRDPPEKNALNPKKRLIFRVLFATLK